MFVSSNATLTFFFTQKKRFQPSQLPINMNTVYEHCNTTAVAMKDSLFEKEN